MAERFKRYSSKGLALRMPSVDFSFEKTRSNNLANLSRTLDSMSEMFYKNAVQTAKIEGAEYGALNAPTVKQLEDASESNTELDFVGDKTTVFGKYARTATLEATSDNLTLIAKQNIADIVLRAKRDDVEPTEVAKQLDSVVSGLADVLDTESPVTARKFKASLGVYSNAEYKTYASKYITDKQKEIQANWSLDLENTLTTVLPKIIQSGTPTKVPTGTTKDGQTVNKTIQTATTLQTIQSIKEKVLARRPVGMSAEAILALEKRFDDRVLQVAKNIINDSIFNNEDPQKILDLINNNQFDKLPIAIQSAFSVVEGENKAVLKKIASEAVDEKRGAIERKINHNNLVREDLIKKLDIQAYGALINPNSDEGYKQLTDIILQLDKLDPKKAKEFKEILKNNPKLQYASTSKPTVFNSITIAFNEKEVFVTQSRLNKYLLDKELSKEDYDKFSSDLRARNNTEFNRVLAEARASLKIPVSIVGNSAIMKNWAFNVLKSIERGMYEARRTDPNFVASKWLEDNFVTYKTRGEATEYDIVKNIAEKHLSIKNLNTLINTTTDTARKQQLIDDKTRILNWNATATNEKKIKGY